MWNQFQVNKTDQIMRITYGFPWEFYFLESTVSVSFQGRSFFLSLEFQMVEGKQNTLNQYPLIS